MQVHWLGNSPSPTKKKPAEAVDVKKIPASSLQTGDNTSQEVTFSVLADSSNQTAGPDIII